MAQNSFVKAFLPGLVLGVIVGGVAGAFLPPLLENSATFGGESAKAPVERTAPTPAQIDEARRHDEQGGPAPVATTPEAPKPDAPKDGTTPATPVDPAAKPETVPPAGEPVKPAPST